MEIAQVYLGYGVYASYDGNHICLTSREQDSTTPIALDQNALAALNRYAKEIGRRLAKAK